MADSFVAVQTRMSAPCGSSSTGGRNRRDGVLVVPLMQPTARVLVLGAGQSAPFLIQDLLDHAEAHDWEIVVADRDESLAHARVDGHPRGQARYVDATDEAMLVGLIRGARVVVNFLAPAFQRTVAQLCVALGRHMVSASYLDDRVRSLHNAAKEKGVTLLAEVGLDPGMDHMSAMRLIHRIQGEGGRIVSFASYGSGVPAPEDRSNPLGYAITWNARNVTMAGENGAQFMRRGAVRVVPYPELFRRTWPVEVPGVGTMEAYPNRDSLGYREGYGIAHTRTLIRGTLRYPGFAETWYHVAQLGLPNERIRIPGLAEHTYAELTEMFLGEGEGPLDARVAHRLGLPLDGQVMQNLRFLGLFDDRRIGDLGSPGGTAAGALTLLMADRLKLGPHEKDMVVLHHEVQAEWTEPERRTVDYRSTLVLRGEPGGATAMSRTVGLPAAIGARMLMTDAFPRVGAQIPTEPAIYGPMLDALAQQGIHFVETKSMPD